MGEHVIKLPDVGEGVAEAELVEWHVKVGDLVREDTVLAAVMTDKATVEIPSPVDGEIVWLGAEIGDTVAVGSPIVRLKVAGEGNVTRRRGGRRRRPSRRRSRPHAEASPKAEAEKPPPSSQKPKTGRSQRAEVRRRLRSQARAPAVDASSGAPRPKARSRWPRRPCGCAPTRPASTCARSRHRPGRPHHP